RGEDDRGCRAELLTAPSPCRFRARGREKGWRDGRGGLRRVVWRRWQPEELFERREAGLMHLGGELDTDVAEVPRFVHIAGHRDLVRRIPQQESKAVGVGH